MKFLYIGILFITTLFGDTNSFPSVIEAGKHTTLSASAQGTLIRKIKQGEELTETNKTLAIIEHGELLVQLEQAKSSGNYLKGLITNADKLNQQGLGSYEEIQKLKYEASLNQFEVKQLKLQIDKSIIKAPFEGKLIQWHIKSHEWVSVGQPVVELIDHKDLNAICDLPAHYIKTLNEGDRAKLKILSTDEILDCKLKKLAPVSDIRSHTIKTTWSVLKPSSLLRPGLRAELILKSEN